MSKEQDDRTIGIMMARLRKYGEHCYPITFQEDQDGDLTLRVYAIKSPLTGALYVSRLSDGKGNNIYRMDHDSMQTPHDLVKNYQGDFATMYTYAAALYTMQELEQASYG